MAAAAEPHCQLAGGAAQTSGACRAGYTPGFNFWAFICSFLGLQTVFSVLMETTDQTSATANQKKGKIRHKQ